MKSTIQAEAGKAAKKIREALEEFNRVTGFEMRANAGWRPVGEPGEQGAYGDGLELLPRRLDVRVHVDGGFGVKA